MLPWVQALLQRVVQILMKGRDSAAALTVIEGYLLMAGPELPELLQPYLPSIAAALERCVNAAANALAARESAAAPKGQQSLHVACREWQGYLFIIFIYNI